MSAVKKIRVLLIERGMTLTDLSNRLNKSVSSVSNKMIRNNLSERDLQEIAEALNVEYEIVFTDKETGKKF